MKSNAIFPLTIDGLYPLSERQKKGTQSLQKKIAKKTYKLVKNNCLCGNINENLDFIIAEKDRHGIPTKFVLCRNCGLIRLKKMLDHKSAILFFENECRELYTRNIFTNATRSLTKVFDDAYLRGKSFTSLLKDLNLLSSIKTVHEIGCESGGILQAFQEEDCMVSGYDFHQESLDFGNKKRLNLFHGNNKKQIPKQDLVIISHVLQHITNPIEAINDAAMKLADNKYLFVEVIGFFWDAPGYHFYPILSLQNQNVYQFFYKFFLESLFKQLGFNIIYGDERSTFIVQKPLGWQPVYPKNIYNKEMSEWAKKIELYLIEKARELPDHIHKNKNSTVTKSP